MNLFARRAAAVALALLAGPGVASAAFVTGFSGSNQFTANNTGGQTGQADGVVNFAVFDTQTGDPTGFFAGLSGTTQFGAGGFGAGRYIYLYQVVNTNPFPPEAAIRGLTVTTTPGSVNSAGFILNTVFTDGPPATPASAVGPVGNVRLGAESATNNTVLLSAPPTGTATRSAAVESLEVAQDPEDPSLLTFNFFRPAPLQSGIGSNGFSSLLFLTSDFRPAIGTGALFTANTATQGGMPVPTPEPGTLALIGLGMPLLGWGYTRRLRANRATATA